MDGSDTPVRSVARALDLFLALEDGPMTLGSLARMSRLSKGTAHRILASLAAAGLVIQDPASETYALGPGCFGILDAVVHGAGGLGVITRPILERLCAETRETVALYVRAGPQRICVAQVPSPQPVHYTARLGMENPIYAGAMGKILLAYSDPREREEILDRMPLVAWTSATITDRTLLADELDEIRRRGHAESHGERAAGVAAISAPVFGVDGQIIAALSIVGPDERMTGNRLLTMTAPLVSAAADATARIAEFTREAGASRHLDDVDGADP